MGEHVQTPQARYGCACPPWSSARSCIHLRYAPDDSEPYEECDCACHEEEEDDEFDEFSDDFHADD